jgi:hypothetical protein
MRRQVLNADTIAANGLGYTYVAAARSVVEVVEL